ncbi:MAG: ExbD/TolR family protein [Porticoccaceae bacterium]
MKFQRSKRVEPGIDITPFVDVVFLLVIFFMVSTTFTKESRLTLQLPTADVAPTEAPEQSIEISVDREGGYAINGIALVNRQRDTLVRGLRELAAGNTDTPLTIRADGKASHQAVVTAMEAAGNAGFAHLNITTQQPEPGAGQP